MCIYITMFIYIYHYQRHCQVLKFFSKLSSGSGEQLLTRQMCRLGQLLPLPEVLTLCPTVAGPWLGGWLFLGKPWEMLVFQGK